MSIFATLDYDSLANLLTGRDPEYIKMICSFPVNSPKCARPGFFHDLILRSWGIEEGKTWQDYKYIYELYHRVSVDDNITRYRNQIALLSKSGYSYPLRNEKYLDRNEGYVRAMLASIVKEYIAAELAAYFKGEPIHTYTFGVNKETRRYTPEGVMLDVLHVDDPSGTFIEVFGNSFIELLIAKVDYLALHYMLLELHHEKVDGRLLLAIDPRFSIF